MSYSYIYSSFFLSTRCSLFFSPFSQRLHALFFRGAFLVYGLVIFNPSPPLVGHVDDLLDACPIRNLLEVLWVAVSWNILAHGSFPHKCGQLVRCWAFNVVVTAFFSDISWFTVNSFIWNLSLEVWYPLSRYSLGNRAPTPHNAPRGSLGPWETTFVRHYLSLSHCPTCLSYCSSILELPYILGHGPRSNTSTQLIYPHTPIFLLGGSLLIRLMWYDLK